jgi:flagellar basal body-associated protein FliL
MAIFSIICGIIGLFGLIYSFINFIMIQEYILIGFISFVITLLALIFGIIKQKKDKNSKYYSMATAGFVMGLIGIIVQFLPIIYIFYTTLSIKIHNTYLEKKGEEYYKGWDIRKSSILTYDTYNKSLKFQSGLRIDYCSLCRVFNCGSAVLKLPPMYYFKDIGSITIKSKEINPEYVVTIEIILGYNYEDDITTSELNARKDELREYLRMFLQKYFSEKYATELYPKDIRDLDQQIIEILNTRFLNNGKVRYIKYNQLSIKEL